MRFSEDELERILKNPAVKIHGEATQKTRQKKRSARKGKSKDEFQSLAECRYYERYIWPLEIADRLERWSMHESFEVVEALTFQGIRFRTKVYSPDFVLYFKDGSVKVVEVKDEKIRRLQREYPLKKQLFIMKYCIPNGWDFEEVRASELTQA